MRFRKRPVEIEAVRWTGKNSGEIWQFCPECQLELIPFQPTSLAIVTLEGVIHAKEGDWIIKGIDGEFYPCRPDIFEKTYEAVA